MNAARLLRGVRRRLFPPASAPAVVKLPSSKPSSRGTVVLSYLTDCFASDPARHYHSNRWECRCMARVFYEAGYDVEALNYEHREYTPPPECVAVIDIHSNLERLASLVPASAKKMLHATGAYWEFQNQAELDRLSALRVRRGVELPPRRQVPPSRAIEVADVATTTGNDFTIGTFAFARKTFHRIPVTSTWTQDCPAKKTFAAARTRFLWFGSHGLVHKGLDLVLEAFARAKELQLTVAGPVGAEPDFAALYQRELSLPNVRVVDWFDTRSPQFAELLATHGAIIYPSCSEGGGGSVVTCLHGGLIPIVTREASVDVGDFGFLLRNVEIDTLVAAVREVAALGPSDFAARSRAAWEFAQRQHTREHFERTYRRLVAEVFRLPNVG